MEKIILQTMEWSLEFLSASEIFNFLVSSFRYYESKEICTLVKLEFLQSAQSFIEIGTLMSHNPPINSLELAIVATICFMDIHDISTSRQFRKWIARVLPESRIGKYYSIEKIVHYRIVLLQAWLEQRHQLGETVEELASMLLQEDFLPLTERGSPFGSKGCSTSENTPERTDTTKNKMEECPSTPLDMSLPPPSHPNVIAAEIKLGPAGDLSFDENID